MMPFRTRHAAPRGRWIVLAMAAVASATATAEAQEPSPPVAEEQSLETSDGLRFGAWYYPAPGETKPTATVILIHDIEGSHK